MCKTFYLRSTKSCGSGSFLLKDGRSESMRLVKEDKNLPSLDTELLIKIVALILWLYALVPVLRIMTEDHQDLFYFVRSGFIHLASLNDYFFTSKQWKTWVFNLCINSVTIWTFGIWWITTRPDLRIHQ